MAASQAKLEKENCPIVAAPRYDTVTGNSKMQRLGDGVQVSLRLHRKQPCHAAFITSRGDIAYVCMHRPRPPSGPSPSSCAMRTRRGPLP